MNSYKLKTLPQDFLVTEAIILPYDYSNVSSNIYHYYLLRKCSYTTFEAIDLLSSKLGIDRYQIGYSGLKDEDGITEQFISLPLKISSSLLAEVNSQSRNNNFKFLELLYFRQGCANLRVGELQGNNFHIVIRKLPENLAKTLYEHKKIPLFFINYYGPQRFGLPNAPKNTHLIGEALIKKDHVSALEFLKAQSNEVGERARNNTLSEGEFFDSLDRRLLAFYQSSFYSYKWNGDLKEKIIANCKSPCIEQVQDGISYLYPTNSSDKFDLIRDNVNMKYVRVVPSGSAFEEVELIRQMLVQTSISCNAIYQDTEHLGYLACDIDFFLPTGSYASVAIPQLLDGFCRDHNLFGEIYGY